MPVLASVTGLDIEGVIVRCLILADLTDRRRGEEELAGAYAELSRSAHELEEAQRIGRIGSWFWNAATDEITCSTQIFRILGIDPTSSGTMLRTTLAASFHPEDATLATTARERALADRRPFVVEQRVVHADGDVRQTVTRGEVVSDADGAVAGMRGTTQDVTEQRRAATAVARGPRGADAPDDGAGRGAPGQGVAAAGGPAGPAALRRRGGARRPLPARRHAVTGRWRLVRRLLPARRQPGRRHGGRRRSRPGRRRHDGPGTQRPAGLRVQRRPPGRGPRAAQPADHRPGRQRPGHRAVRSHRPRAAHVPLVVRGASAAAADRRGRRPAPVLPGRSDAGRRPGRPATPTRTRPSSRTTCSCSTRTA